MGSAAGKALNFIMSPLGTIIGGKTGRIISAIGITALGIATGNPQLIMLGLGMGMSALQKKPKVPKASLDRLNLDLDPSAPATIVFGHTAMATDLRYQAATGTDQEYWEQIVCVAGHQVESIDEIWFDSELAWTVAGGAQGRFAGYLTVTPRLVGTSANGIAIDSVWTSTCTLTGRAYYHAKFKLTGNSKKAESPFAQGIPSRVTVRGKGARVYDPRFDSTAGGSGPQRINDQTTWAFSTGGVESGRNPALQDLFYMVGWRINGKLAVGRGFPTSRIHLPSFVTCANLCDESVAKAVGGTEPRYRSDGVVSEADAPETVFSALHAAMAAEHTDANGRIALRIEHNDLAVPVLALTEADIIDDDRWVPLDESEEIPNVVMGHYTDASNAALYQPVPAPNVTLASLDGLDRYSEPFDLVMVQSASQWQRLAKMFLQRKQYPTLFTANFGARAWGVSYGQVVTLSHGPLGLAGVTFRVVYHKVARGGVVRMVLQLVTAAFYQWDAEELPAVQAAAAIPFDPLNDPFVQAISDAGTTAEWPAVTDPAGTKPDDNADVTLTHTAAGIVGQGALAILNAAPWATHVAGVPVELNDGRIAAALDVAGDLARNITTTRANGSNLLRRTSGGLFTGELAADVTLTHTAAGVVGQGALATQSAVNLGFQTTGYIRLGTTAGQIADEAASAFLSNANTITAFGTAAAIAGQGALATQSAVNLGFQTTGYIKLGAAAGQIADEAASAFLSNANTITAFGTAAAIAGQGALATLSAVDLEGGSVTNKTRIGKLNAGTGVANDSSILPANVIYAVSPALKEPVTISDTDNGGTVTINVGAAVFYPDGGGTVTFPAGGIPGCAYGTTYYIKRVGVNPVTAPTGTGWSASTTLSVNVGDVPINSYPTRASGAAPSPPPPPPPGGGAGCVSAAAWVETRNRGFVRARDIVPGDLLRVLTDDRRGTRWEPCTGNVVRRSAAVRIRASNGFTLTCSVTTPITLRDGSNVFAPDAGGKHLPVREGRRLAWRLCTVQHVGETDVAHIRCNQATYAAGDEPGRSILTHNPIKP